MSLTGSPEASMTLNNGRHENTEIFYSFIQYQFCRKHYQIFTISICYAQQKPYIFCCQNQYQKRLLQKASLLLKKFHVQLRSLYGEQYQTFNAHNLLHLCFASRILARYGHFLVSVMKIIMGIYKIYFMEHSILHFKLLLLHVSNKRSQKSYQFFPIN